MTYEKAVRLLELKNNFSEDDLKKSYKRLIVKWHPDVNDDKRKAEEMTKELNLAKQFLLDYLNRSNPINKNYKSKDNTEINISAYVYKNSLKLYNQYIGNYNYYILKGDVSSYFNKIFLFIKNFQRVASSFDSISKVDNTILIYKELINDEIVKYITSYCESKGFKYEFDSNRNILIEGKYRINPINCLYNIYNELIVLKKENKEFEMLINTFVDEFNERFLSNASINYIYGDVSSKYLILFKGIINDFKKNCLNLNSEDELYEMYTSTNYLLRSLRKDYAIKICEYYGIEIEDINNDFITISGVKYSLDKDLFSLKSSIEIVKASEELPNSISNSNDSGKKVLKHKK